MTHDNLLYELSKKFALRIIKLYSYLINENHELIMSKQVYRSGTSIGANIAESMNAQSRADFVSKLSISLKEATETKYWLELLHESDHISDTQFDSIVNDLNIIIGTLVNTINVYDLLKYNKLVVTLDAVKKLEEVYA